MTVGSGGNRGHHLIVANFAQANAMDMATLHDLLFSQVSPVHIDGVTGQSVILDKGIGGHIGHIIPK